jgi:hypothetical protein
MAFGATAGLAADKKPIQRDMSKDFDDLTPSEHIAIRAAAKAAYKAKKLKVLHVCADPGNMPLSNIKREGFQNKLAELLADSMGARLEYHWQPFIERGLTRSTFDEHMCDVMFDVPVDYGRLQDTLRARLSQRQGPGAHRPRRSQAEGPDHRRLPDLRHPHGTRQARHHQQCQAAGADA